MKFRQLRILYNQGNSDAFWMQYFGTNYILLTAGRFDTSNIEILEIILSYIKRKNVLSYIIDICIGTFLKLYLACNNDFFFLHSFVKVCVAHYIHAYACITMLKLL